MMMFIDDDTPPNAVYGYARVSLVREGEEQYSIDDQQRRIANRADEYQWPLVETFVDPGISAGIPWRKRPQGHALFAQLQPGDMVIASRLDRCFRSALDALTTLEDFKARNIRLLALDFGELTGEGVSELIVTILAAVAEFERELVSERNRAIHQHLRSLGKATGGTRPFGYDIDAQRYLVPIPEQQEAIDYMCARDAAGAPATAIRREIRVLYNFTVDTKVVRRCIKWRRENLVVIAPHIAAAGG
jgi:putative DNA-invertase from lambdoid prophage Rac